MQPAKLLRVPALQHSATTPPSIAATATPSASGKPVHSTTAARHIRLPAAIGAHGSNNEYLLRNSIGTDERHTQNAYTVAAGVVTYTNPNGAFLVCYNCHSYSKYGSVFNATGDHRPATLVNTMQAVAATASATPFRSTATPPVRPPTAPSSSAASKARLPRTSTPAFAPGFPLNRHQPATGEQNPDFGNIFGIQCLNCHNSGVGNGYGGIHGSANNTTHCNTVLLAAAAVLP